MLTESMWHPHPLHEGFLHFAHSTCASHAKDKYVHAIYALRFPRAFSCLTLKSHLEAHSISVAVSSLCTVFCEALDYAGRGNVVLECRNVQRNEVVQTA